MSMYNKTHCGIVISLQLIKIKYSQLISLKKKKKTDKEMGKAQEEGTKGNIHGLVWEPQVRQICPLPD